MENFIRSPDPLKDNKPKTWLIWKEEFLIFMGLLGYVNRSQSYKANLFKNLIGSIGLETINKLSFDCIEDKENLDILIKKLDNYYVPQETEKQKRYKFFNSNMKSDETIENYIQNLKEQAKGCNFGSLADSLIKDVIILHANDKTLRQKYLQEENLTYDKIVAIYKNHKIQEQEKVKNCNIKSKNYKQENKNKMTNVIVPKQGESASGTSKQGERASGTFKQGEPAIGMHKQGNCWRCHTKHPVKQCPAWNYRCTKCNTLHHFEKCCKGPMQNTERNPNMNNLDLNHQKSVGGCKMFHTFSGNI